MAVLPTRTWLPISGLDVALNALLGYVPAPIDRRPRITPPQTRLSPHRVAFP